MAHKVRAVDDEPEIVKLVRAYLEQTRSLCRGESIRWIREDASQFIDTLNG